MALHIRDEIYEIDEILLFDQPFEGDEAILDVIHSTLDLKERIPKINWNSLSVKEKKGILWEELCIRYSYKGLQVMEVLS